MYHIVSTFSKTFMQESEMNTTEAIKSRRATKEFDREYLMTESEEKELLSLAMLYRKNPQVKSISWKRVKSQYPSAASFN